MIADCTVYDILANYTNQFRLQVDEQSDSTGTAYERTQTQSTQTWLTKVAHAKLMNNRT